MYAETGRRGSAGMFLLRDMPMVHVAMWRRADALTLMFIWKPLNDYRFPIPIRNIFPQLTGPISGLVWLCQL